MEILLLGLVEVYSMHFDFSGVLNLSVIQVKPKAHLWYR